MATVTSADYYDVNNNHNKVGNGENRYTLGGTFSGNQVARDISLSPTVGAVDLSKTTITSQSTTQINGKFHYARGAHPDVKDDNGAMGCSVAGSTPIATSVTFPSMIEE